MDAKAFLCTIQVSFPYVFYNLGLPNTHTHLYTSVRM